MRQVDFLLTGASGFFGGNILRGLNQRYAFCTLGKGKTNNVQSDLAESLPSFERNLSFTRVIHAAGKAHSVPKNNEQASEFLKVNFLGTTNLCRALELLEKMPEHFVFISTVAVYGVDSGEMLGEETPLNGESPYALSKIRAEEFLQEWCKKNSVKLTVLRLPLIAGPNPPGNLGAMIRAMKKGYYFPIGNGNVRKSMVLAEDVANFIPRVTEVGGVYNLTDGYNPTMKELELATAQKLGIKLRPRVSNTFTKVAAKIGDLLGGLSPLNTDKYNKLTSSLTFSDQRAVELAGWSPRSVIKNLPF